MFIKLILINFNLDNSSSTYKFYLYLAHCANFGAIPMVPFCKFADYLQFMITTLLLYLKNRCYNIILYTFTDLSKPHFFISMIGEVYAQH